jgi:hypothetical protein
MQLELGLGSGAAMGLWEEMLGGPHCYESLPVFLPRASSEYLDQASSDIFVPS